MITNTSPAQVAIDAQGNGVQTVLAQPGIVSENRFWMTIRNTAPVKQTNIVLFPSFMGLDVTHKPFDIGSLIDTRNGMQDPSIQVESNLDVMELNNIFRTVGFSFRSMSLNTDNTANYNNSLIQKDPRYTFFGAETKKAVKRLQDFRVNVGSGYGESISDFPFPLVKDKFIQVLIEKLEPNSEMRFDFNIGGIADNEQIRAL